MILASSDIFVLAPDFERAIVGLHNVLAPIAVIVCFAGLILIASQAMRERSIQEIIPAMIRIFMVSMFLVNMPAIGNWIGDLVTSIEQAAGISGNPMQAFVAAINQKYGVDLSKTLGQISPGGSAGIGLGTPSANSTVSNYGYAGDSTGDSNSLQGIGAFAFDSAPGSLVAGQSLALSPDLAAGLTPGQQVSVTLANGQTINGIYADKVPATYNGQTLSRVDIYDPHHQFDGLSGTSVKNIQGGALPSSGSNIGDFFNAMIHPVEAAQVAGLGMFTLVLSFVAAFIQWLVALLQSILFYCEIALAPLFVGFLLVRGYEIIAKGFILSFVAICLWPISFLITGLVTQLLLGLAANTGNNSAAGAGNALGMSFLWMICISIWVVFSSIFGPWMISKRVVSGASGIADAIVGAHSFARGVGSQGMRTVSGASGAVFAEASPSMSSRGAYTNFARRPVNKP